MKDKIEETGGELTTVPNEKYAKFFAKFKDIETLPIEEWKSAHLLGYFCKKYKEVYGVEYSWKFNNPSPAKCFEIWQFNTLCAKLSANPKILKEYIDWAFQNLVPKAKRRLTSISFLTKDEVVNPYKMNLLLGLKKNINIDRSTPLSKEFIDIIEYGGWQAKTYGDLAFLNNMFSNPISDMFLSWMGVIDALKIAGLNKEILEKIV